MKFIIASIFALFITFGSVTNAGHRGHDVGVTIVVSGIGFGLAHTDLFHSHHHEIYRGHRHDRFCRNDYRRDDRRDRYYDRHDRRRNKHRQHH